MKKSHASLCTIALTAVAIAVFPGLAAAVDATGQRAAAGRAETEPRSLKERLSDKASDEQRVNNCHVPLDRRGSKPRPDCPTSPQADRSGDTASPPQ